MTKTSDLTIILSSKNIPDETVLNQYLAAGDQLILLLTENGDSNPPFFDENNVLSISYNPENGKTTALNQAVRRANNPFILWLETGESIPDIPPLESKTFYPARIVNTVKEHPAYQWQVRLFPKPSDGHSLFTSFEIPNIYHTVTKWGAHPATTPLAITRKGSPFSAGAIRKEIDHGEQSPMQAFWKGLQASTEENFKLAARCFNEVLKAPIIAPWNKLAAINSRANALMEMQELKEAKETAEKSLQLSTNQWAPYLTLYQYYHLNKQRDVAYQALLQYQQRATIATDANWDVFLPEDQTFFLMAENAFYQGRHEQAYQHYQHFFDCHNGCVSQTVLEKLFLYSVELNERDKAIQYFEALFDDYLPGNIGQSQSKQILEALSLFTDNGWYDFASDIYRQLVSHQPENNTWRQGWIRTLIKNNEIQKARALI